MSFKDFFLQELAGKNAYHRMVRQHPSYQSMPSHVRGEFVNTAFGHSVNSSSTKAMQAKLNRQTPAPTAMKPSEFLNNSPYKDRQWTKQAEVLQASPTSFDEKTLHIMINRCFGYRPMPTIRNDLARMDTQKGNLDPATAGKNEPVVMLQDSGQKIKLQEGWHRTMSMLVWEGSEEYGAPEGQVQILKQYAQKLRQLDQPFIEKHGEDGLTNDNRARLAWLTETMPVAEELKNQLDFDQWRPVPLRGFVGRMQQKNQSNGYDVGTTDQITKPTFDYDVGTAPMKSFHTGV